MFAKLLALLASLAILAVATPTPNTANAPADSCSTGPLQCCSQVLPANSLAAAPILGSLGVVVQDVNALVGLACTPITVVGVGAGDSCSAETVCCTDNSVGGAVSVGCLPVTL